MEDSEKNDLTKSIEDGTYYVAARSWYSELFHSPIAQRSYYFILLILVLANLYFSVFALIGVFPIKPPVPFTLYSNDVLDDVTTIRKLAVSNAEDKNTALMKYMITNYVINRESYDLGQYELRYRNIWSNSTDRVFEIYKQTVSAANPLSPYHQYTDIDKRVVTIESVVYERAPVTSHATVIFRAAVVSIGSNREIKHTKWKATIEYKYTDFKVSQKLNAKNPIAVFFGLTGDAIKGSGEKQEITPMSFIVSDYQLKELLE